MRPFGILTAGVVPLDRADVDTDAILPKQFLGSVEKTGYGAHLFAAWRYRNPAGAPPAGDEPAPNPDFVLNDPRYRDAEVLLCRQNFGCGSSREQAVWALRDYGIRALIGPKFGEIFYDNCLKNGILPVVLADHVVDRLFAAVFATPAYRVTIDLPVQTVRTPEGASWPFSLDPFRKRCLIEGLDDIGYVLTHADRIRAFEARRHAEAPWVFGGFSAD